MNEFKCSCRAAAYILKESKPDDICGSEEMYVEMLQCGLLPSRHNHEHVRRSVNKAFSSCFQKTMVCFRHCLEMWTERRH